MTLRDTWALAALWALTLCFVALALLGLGGVFYDTEHAGDTGFILGAGWRVYNGLEPAIDFGHFYGGFTSTLVALAMGIFGTDIHALEGAFLLAALGAALAAVVIGWGGLSRLGLAAVIATTTTLMLTRYPLEVSGAVTEVIAAHSFLYNRLGFVAVLLAGVYVSFAAPSRGLEIGRSVLIGAILVAAAFTKPTFAVLIPAVLIGLVIQRRWTGLLGCIAGLAAVMALVDPVAAQLRAASAYIAASVGERGDAQITAVIRKAIQVPMAQPVAMAAGLAGLVLALRHLRVLWAPLLAVVGVAVAGVGMAATMGGGGSLGHLALPVICMALITLSGIMARQDLPTAPTTGLLSLVVVFAFALPHLANLAGVTLEARSHRDAVRISQGAYAGYLNIPRDAEAQAVTQYDMLVDGIDALQTLGDHSDRGIVADSNILFEFPLRARPVPGFPLWPRAHSPEFDAATAPIEVDLILLGRGAVRDATLGPVLRRWVSDDFQLCRQSAYWDIYARTDTAPAACDAG